MTSNSSPACRAGDRTRAAIHRWTAALPAARYLVAAIPAGGGGPTHRRLLTPGELDRALSWLRWLNCRGHHIVGRPWSPRHVLIDDLPEAALKALSAEHRPAAIVESSPGNFQAWLTLGDEGAVSPAIAGAAAKLLAARHGGDPGAASPCQPGRLPGGFTNRKPCHRRDDGLFPFVLLRHADGPVVDPVGPEILADAARALASRQHRHGPEPSDAAPGGPERRLLRRDPAVEHAEAMARLAALLPPGIALDRSRADYAAARRLLARGMSVTEAVGVVMAGERATDMLDAAAAAYARRTVEAAMASLKRRPAPWC